MTTFKIREAGKNGTVEVFDDRLVRTIKHRVTKNDVQTIPLKAITSVHHNRKITKTDTVQLQAGVVNYEWKVSKADEFVRVVNERIFSIES
jgi:hypothetical protein